LVLVLVPGWAMQRLVPELGLVSAMQQSVLVLVPV